jgi:hypothetical protein
MVKPRADDHLGHWAPTDSIFRRFGRRLMYKPMSVQVHLMTRQSVYCVTQRMCRLMARFIFHVGVVLVTTLQARPLTM